MTKDWHEKAIIQDLRQAQRHSEQIARYYATRQKRTQTHRLAQMVQERIIRKIERMGYIAHTTTHTAPFDAWIAGCKVEFKGSHWQQTKRRYQANIRHHNADLVIFDAINGSDHYFIIPMDDIAPRKSLEIHSYNVNHYQGQWAVYLEAWDVLEQAIEASRRPVQLTYLDTAQLALAAPER